MVSNGMARALALLPGHSAAHHRAVGGEEFLQPLLRDAVGQVGDVEVGPSVELLEAVPGR